MRPGVPWSVKGIDDQARQAAKSAAKDAGLTLGQWLNSIILETAESSSGHPAAATAAGNKRSGKRKSVRNAPDAGQSDTEIKSRLDQLAEQLTDLTKQNQDTAVASFIEPTGGAGADSGSLEAIVDRIEANERRSDAAIDEVNQRLQAMTDQLAEGPAGGMPTRPEDVPGFTALESALRNIVDHIETSEQRTVDTLAAVQARMVDISTRANSAQEQGIDSNAPAIQSLEQRVTELAGRLEHSQAEITSSSRAYVDSNVDQLSQRIDAVHHSTEAIAGQAQTIAARSAEEQGQQIEDRLKSVIAEMRATEQESPLLTKLHGEVESLNQRFDDIKADAASESDVQTLRTAIEQLTGQIGTGPDLSAIGELEQRLGDLAAKFEQGPAPDGVTPQMSELEQRVQDLDEKLQAAMAVQPDGSIPANDLMTQITSVNERLSATEQKLGALETIEKSISQLFESVEQNRVWAKEAAEEAANRAVENKSAENSSGQDFAPSSELLALQDGLGAVKASAELADQRNQDTLEAVHDTLEQIIMKLTDLEQHSDQVPVQAVAGVSQLVQEAPVEASAFVAGMEDIAPADLPNMIPPSVQVAEDPVAEIPADEPLDDVHQVAASIVEQQVAVEELVQPAISEQVVGEELAPPPTAVETPASPIDTPAPPVEHDREDFIAAARRAAQNASSQSRLSVLGGLNHATDRGAAADNEVSEEGAKSGSKFSLSFLRGKKAKAAEHETIIPDVEINGATGVADDKAVNGKRRQLILAGLILLAAVSAYSLGGLGKKGGSPKSEPAKTSELGQTLTLEQLQDSLSLAQNKISMFGRTNVETLPAASQLQNKTSQAAAPGMTSIEKVAEVDMGQGSTFGQTSTVGMTPPANTFDQVQTASLAPVSNETAKYDQAENVPLGTNQTASIEAPSTMSLNDTSMTNSTSPASMMPDGNMLPAAIGSTSLRQAAVSGMPNAQYVIATRFLDGKEVGKDFKQAGEWYSKAAAQGLAPAQYRLGTLFERGRGMPKDMTAARLWYERAAERNNVKSMHNLAVIYSNNENKDAQFGKAAQWFHAAAQHGLRDSAYNLAVLHERGLGLPKDLIKAYFWFGVAARLQDADAATKVATMRKQLSPAALTKVDNDIKAWRPKKPDNTGNLVSITDPAWNVGPPPAAAQPVTTQQTTMQSPPAPPAVPGPTSDGDMILTAQQILSGMGYDVGPMDGVMGSRTANAVRLFQLQTGRSVNGTVSPELVQALVARQG